MSDGTMVKKSIQLRAEVSAVWEALTNPAITEKYFFACRAISEWKEGSPLIYSTTVDGNEIVPVMGMVTAVEKHSLLQHTCYAAENEKDTSKHTTATYRFSAEDGGTRLTVTQGPFEDAATRDETDGSWDMVLEGLKATLEGPHQA